MRMRIEMNVKNICFIAVILVCVLALSYAIYHYFTKEEKEDLNETKKQETIYQAVDFEDLFDNKVNYQDYNTNFVNKLDPQKELVYTTHTLNEVYENKYDIQAYIPTININNEKVININKEISSIFYDKMNSIIANSKNKDAKKTIYTVSYSSYLNENILSLAIKATLKEGDNAQRVIVKTYTYNLSTNEEIELKDMLEIKGVSITLAEDRIKQTIEDSINYSKGLSSLGYEAYDRDIKSDIYSIENSNNYFLGPDESIYIVYAYGNSNFTSEMDVVYIR